MFNYLLARSDGASIAEVATLLAAKWFREREKAPFDIGAVSAFTIEIATAYAERAARDPIAVQVPFGNSIVVVTIMPEGFPEGFEVRHGFGGVYFSEADRLLQFDVEGLPVAAFIRLTEIEPISSFVRTTPEISVVNDKICWSVPYLETLFLGESRNVPKPARPAALDMPVATLTESVAIGIPVYNSPHLFARLFADLARTLPDDPNLLIRIVDDCSDAYSVEVLRRLIGELRDRFGRTKIVHTRNEPNIGFIRTCNLIFEETRGHDLFVLLTTDVRLPDAWLDRMLSPFRSDEKIVLATPWATNGANLHLETLPGHSWSDMDHIARGFKPVYPDAETTVGYCMGFRPSALDRAESLFSLVFENGYGDDSDLYYRMVSKGFRGVLVDNMVIYHKGGGSFDLLDNVAQLRSDNFKTFSSIWMPLYRARIHEAAARLETLRAARFKVPTRRDVDVLFVLPIDLRVAGGVEAVFRIVESLQERGIRAGIFCTSEHPKSNETHFEYRAVNQGHVGSLADIVGRFGVPRLVVATSHDTVPVVQSLTKMLGCRSAHFLQGPEMAFSSGGFSAAVVKDLERSDDLLCVSSYLADLVAAVSGRQATVIPYGPDPNEFYNLGRNKARTVAIQFAGRADKGSDLAGIAVPILLRHGYEVEVFGHPQEYIDYDPRLKVHGFATTSKLRKIFQSSSHYLDLSRYEGLGMLGLEALWCGALPVTLRNGGTAEILGRHCAGVMVNGIEELHALPEILDRSSREIDVMAAAGRVQSEVGLARAVDHFQKYLEKVL